MDDPPGAQSAPRSHHHHLRPISQASGGGSGSGGGGREDCWSEGATETLVKAWGDRYLELNRGNLRQKDWKEVADAVNAGRDGAAKPRKTDAQCKNRIDTLKKKYKLERSKPPPSKWPLYARLDHLIGGVPPPKPTTGKRAAPPPRSGQVKRAAVIFTVKSSKGKPEVNPNPSSGAAMRSYESSCDRDNDGDGDEDEEDDKFEDLRARKHRTVAMDSSDAAACRGLARAILKLGQTYERIESSKQQRMMDLERERVEFTKDLEFQRMRMFMETQLELVKIQRHKHASVATGKKL